MGSFRKFRNRAEWPLPFSSSRSVRSVMSPYNPEKIQWTKTPPENPPARAGSHRICRREFRLPIPDQTLCQVVEEIHIGFVRQFSRADRASAPPIQLHIGFVRRFSRTHRAHAQPRQIHFGFVRQFLLGGHEPAQTAQLHFGFVRRFSRTHRAHAQSIQIHFDFVPQFLRGGHEPAQTAQLHFGFVRQFLLGWS